MIDAILFGVFVFHLFQKHTTNYSREDGEISECVQWSEACI